SFLTHAHREFFVPKLQYFKYIYKTKQIINLLLLGNNFYPMILYRDEFKKKAANYCIRFGHSLWSVNHLPAQETKQIINLLLLGNNFYPVVLYCDEFKKTAANYCIRFGHSLWSVNHLSTQEVKTVTSVCFGL
ncbi:unnamed protein product, partial [Heterotrigona itama]